MSKSAINQSRTKGTANLWALLEKCQGYDLNWLFRGEAPGERSDPAPSLPVMIQKVIDAGYAVSRPDAGGIDPGT